MEIEVTTEINRPVEEVFEYVSTPKNDEKWIEVVLNTSNSSEEMNVGLRWAREADWLVGSTEIIMECIIYEPPNRYGYKTVSGFSNDRLMTTEEFTFRNQEDGTQLTQSSSVQLRGYLRFLQPLLSRMIQTGVESNHMTLKSILEDSDG